MSNLSRRAWLKISYNNKDISADLSPYLKSFSYNDVMSGEADDIQITLEDRAGIWKKNWLPEKGALLTIWIINQRQQNDQYIEELPLGLFEIDEIEMTGPPEEVKIKGVAVPNNSSLRGVDKSRSWEKSKLSIIAKDIAKEAEMELLYDIPNDDDPELDRAEQSQQSDLSFLMKLCNDAGFALKITDKQIVIFDEEKYEQAKPIGTLTKGKSYITSYSIKSSTREVYAACHVKYQQGESKSVIEATFKVPNKNGKTLEINQEVKSSSEAEKLAKKKLREKNKEEITLTMTLIGAFYLSAGVVFNIKNFGVFDGKYLITKATHDIGSGYTVNLDLRRCLDGY